MEPPRGIDQLPTDALIAVLAFVPLGQRLHQASLVCKRWCRLARLSVTSLPPLSHFDVDRVLRSFPAVTSLSAKSLPANLSLFPARLTSLTLKAHASDPCTLACLSKACTQLTQLTIKSRSPDVVSALLRACSTTLDSLSLVVHDSVMSLLVGELPALPRLRSLTVTPFGCNPRHWPDVWHRLTHLSCSYIVGAMTHTNSLLHLNVSVIEIPRLLPLTPHVTALETYTGWNAGDLEALSRTLTNVRSLDLHLRDHKDANGLHFAAAHLVSLRASMIAAQEFAAYTYTRLSSLTLYSPNAFRVVNTGASLPALTHLTLKLRGTLRPELEHLQSVLANVKRLKCLELDVFVSTLSEREALCSFVRYGRGRLGAGLRLQLRVWPHALEKQFREVPELAPFVL